MISCSVLVVMLDSVESYRQSFGTLFTGLEWAFTIFFTIEYILRLYCSRHALSYAKSFFGIVDILAILPTYLSLLLPGTHYLTVIRILRVLRIFRILKFVQYIDESQILINSIKNSFRKIVVFLFGVSTLAIILGSMMYVIEGAESGFTSIPKSVYWAIVTLTTVGYGDISPATTLGQLLATIIMILGYSIIVVPTGFVSIEIAKAEQQQQQQSIDNPN